MGDSYRRAGGVGMRKEEGLFLYNLAYSQYFSMVMNG